MKKNKKFIFDQIINVFLLALVILGTTLLKVTNETPDIIGYLNDYEKKIIDAYLIFFIVGIVLAILIGAIIALSFIKKLSSITRILSIFTAGVIAIPFAGIFVALCKNNTAQIIILILLLIVYLGNIAYQVFLLINESKEINKGKEEAYFSGLNN